MKCLQYISLLLASLLGSIDVTQGQKIEFTDSTYTFREPLDIGNKVDSSISYSVKLNLKCVSCKSLTGAISYKVALTQKGPNSSIVQAVSEDGSFIIGNDNYISIVLKTNRILDQDEEAIIVVSTLDSSKALKGSTAAFISIQNTHPNTNEQKSDPAFGELRVNDIFLGFNFDLLDKNFKANDLYGGLRLFLPGLTRTAQKSKDRLGLMASLYQCNSFSRIANPSLESNENRIGVVQRVVETVMVGGFQSSVLANDSVKIKSTNSIRNFGLSGGLFYLVNRQPKRIVENGIFHFYVGAYTEVIRRSVTSSYQIDTVAREYKLDTVVNNRGGLPSRQLLSIPSIPTEQLYTDFYVGINFPIQYNWKGMIDLRIIPTFGIANVRYNASPDAPIQTKTSSEGSKQFFYMVQFDLLARAGGLGVNLGGELRGYPNVPPIISAYLGTSFKISKIAEFISKM